MIKNIVPFPADPPWANNALYASGNDAGNVTKVKPSAADLADGHRPAQAVATYENWWKNWVDNEVRNARRAMWNLTPNTALANDAMRDIQRRAGGMLAVNNTNNVLRVSDGSLDTALYTGPASYAGEGGNALFRKLAKPTVGPGWVIGGYYTGGIASATTGACGVWTFAEPTLGSYGAIAPLIRADTVRPFTTGVDFLVEAVNGRAYAMAVASGNFWGINASGDPNFYTWQGVTAPTAAAKFAAARISGGVDTICRVDVFGGNLQIQTTTDPFNIVTSLAGPGVTPIDLIWHAPSAAFLLLTSNGTIYQIAPTTGVLTQVIAGTRTVSTGALCNLGYVYVDSAGITWYSHDMGQTETRINIIAAAGGYAGAPNPFFDSEAFWFRQTNGAGQVWSRTQLA